ncbi:MAG: hypothetical protein KDK25_16080, partial [Leptospiraceae bacterium]|nr:hypothetical protein [Leptospiraceae bacterium]
RVSFPAVVGRPKRTGVMVGMGQKDAYIGNEALARKSTLTLNYPIRNGIVQNMDDLEKILHHTFYNELRVAPEEQAVLIIESSFSRRSDRERIVQMLFETFNVPAAYLSRDTVMAAYAAGKTTATVVDMESGYIQVSSIYEGYLVQTIRVSDISEIGTAAKGVVEKLDPERKAAVLANLVISGPNVKAPEGIQKLVQEVAPKGLTIALVQPPSPATAIWKGGSILSNLSTFDEMMINKDEYDESGPAIVHRKCT